MRRTAAFALGTSSLFLALVAILINSPALFYMTTALVTLLGVARLQAWLSVRGLRFERHAPAVVSLGDSVDIEVVVWSERRIRRPLVFIIDQLPPRMMAKAVGFSLPIAPDFDHPVRTAYKLPHRRRGVFRWSALEVVGTDALGLITMTRAYSTDTVELTVLPIPVPVNLDLRGSAGFGISESTSGRHRGAGVEPRGVREYVAGDSLRHVHWRSTARTGKLLVKEFEAGSYSRVAFVFQRSEGTDFISDSLPDEGPIYSSLDLMCSHAMYLIETLGREGAIVSLPQFESGEPSAQSDRSAELAPLLAAVRAGEGGSLAEDLKQASASLGSGALVYVFLSTPDLGAITTVRHIRSTGGEVVALLYDPSRFVEPKRQRIVGRGACDESFRAALQQAGAACYEMPGFAS